MRLPALAGAFLVAAALPLAPSAAADSLDAASYVEKAGAGDLFEIESSRLALQKSQDEEIRNFAQMMITDHTNSTQQVKDAAMKDGVDVPTPILDSNLQKMMDALENSSGDAFDQRYVRAQKIAHNYARALNRAYAATGDERALKAAAAKIADEVQQHVDELDDIS